MTKNTRKKLFLLITIIICTSLYITSNHFLKQNKTTLKKEIIYLKEAYHAKLEHRRNVSDFENIIAKSYNLI